MREKEFVGKREMKVQEKRQRRSKRERFKEGGIRRVGRSELEHVRSRRNEEKRDRERGRSHCRRYRGRELLKKKGRIVEKE